MNYAFFQGLCVVLNFVGGVGACHRRDDVHIVSAQLSDLGLLLFLGLFHFCSMTIYFKKIC